MSLQFLGNFKEIVPYILDKSWLLFKTPIIRPFYISDNPVVMQNKQYHNSPGSLGIAVPGIEVYLPISKTLVLGLYSKTHKAAMI